MIRKHVWWMLLLCTILPVVIMLVFTVSASSYPRSTVQLSLYGERAIFLEHGSEYEDPGVAAVLVEEATGKTTKAQVTIRGQVDPNVVGTYLVRYSAAGGDGLHTVYRRVEVVDTKAPVIELVSDPSGYTLPGSTYQEEGFTATDDYDGDLTAQVHRVETRDAVIYTVTDSSGNQASVTRKILYNDPVPPELTLTGESLFIINAGDDFQEPGYTASDNCDGDLTDQVEISGQVNTFRAGRYTLTYTAKDSYGNAVSQTRVVFVKERPADKVNNPLVGDKFIYLTFDDGPGSETPRLLDILKKYNVPATFFVVNTRYISTVERAAQEGHTIALHTNTHRFKEIYASEEAYFADLETLQNTVKQYTGQTPMLMRFPGGSSNTISSFNEGIMSRLTKLVEEKGYAYFDWNVDSKDAGGAKTPQQVYDNVISRVPKHTESVVLMHDIKTYTIDAVEKIIVWGLDNGYTFRALTKDGPGCHHRVNN